MAFSIKTRKILVIFLVLGWSVALIHAALIKPRLGLARRDKIILHEKDNVVEFKTSGTKIDPGGIAR